MNMRVQCTRTKQLRAPLTTTLGHPKVCSVISTHVPSIINLIIRKYCFYSVLSSQDSTRIPTNV